MNMAAIKQGISQGVKKAGYEISKNSPTILTIAGVGGLGVTVYLAVKATPKAKMRYELAKRVRRTRGEKFTPIDAVKACWKNYIPTAISFTATSACIIGGNVISAKRIKGLNTALNLSETALLAYKDQIVEEIGQKKADALQNKVNDKLAEQNPATAENSYIPRKGSEDNLTWIRDEATGEYFKGNMAKVELAIERCNTRMEASRNECDNEFGIGYICYNDVLEEMDRPPCDLGKVSGFNTDIHGRIELVRDRSGVMPQNSIAPGELYYKLMYRIPPINGYDPRGDYRPFLG